MRIGIFAIKDIPKDSALSYDYQFETSEAQAFKCCCGAAKCRGTMAPISQRDKAQSRYLSIKNGKRMDVTDRKKLIEMGRALTEKSVEQLVEEEWGRCCYLAPQLPGDTLAEVKSGPAFKTFSEARARSIFLTRTIQGARENPDIVGRWHRLNLRPHGAKKDC